MVEEKGSSNKDNSGKEKSLYDHNKNCEVVIDEDDLNLLEEKRTEKKYSFNSDTNNMGDQEKNECYVVSNKEGNFFN